MIYQIVNFDYVIPLPYLVCLQEQYSLVTSVFQVKEEFHHFLLLILLLLSSLQTLFLSLFTFIGFVDHVLVIFEKLRFSRHGNSKFAPRLKSMAA